MKLTRYALAILASMPGTRKELAATSGVCMPTVYHHIQKLHAAGEIHIVDWHITHMGIPAAIFDVGAGRDAICRWKPTTQDQRYRKWLWRMKESGELTHLRAKRRAQYHASKKRPQATWLSVLPGAHA